MNKKLKWMLVPLIMFSCMMQIFSSDITLKNGDRITGKIVDENNESVVIETEYAGKVKVARSYIQKINIEDSHLKTSGGPSNVGSSVAETQAPRPTPAAVPVLASKSKAKGFASRIREMSENWEGNSNLGFSFTSGNSNNITMSTGLRASKVSPVDGMTIYVRSLWNSTHGSPHKVTTQNAFWGGVRYDRNINRELFGFVSYDFERDKPKRLDFRSVAGGGLGHRMVKNDRTDLEFVVGGAWNRTWQAGGGTDTPEGLAGVTFRHRFNGKLRYQNTFTYFQNITDQNEYRYIFDSNVTIDMTKRVGFYVALGNRFNNDPNGNAKKNDFLFTTGLKWNFGKKK
ncbi:hypothetical protein BH10ACI2_BH10ACI2_08220 [soil metagenome]